jgi:formate hydrogenlyase transcriptional activator
MTLPSLRERVEDIPLLARYFTSKYSRRMNRPVQRISVETLASMSRYAWPGNVRELQNFIERAVILSTDGELRAPLMELNHITEHDCVGLAQSKTLRDLEREHILEALKTSNWVIGGPGGAAARLGMKRTSLLYRMEKLHISRSPRASA